MRDGAMDIFISIHAPLTGSDGRFQSFPLAFDPNFNPRSPYGERQMQNMFTDDINEFQSTLPLRGATRYSRPGRGSPPYFNPRSPYGERRITREIWATSCIFQSTLPLRGATQPPENTDTAAQISIHAPLTGSDLKASLLA